MAVIQGITANVIVDGQPLKEINAGDDVEEGFGSDLDYESSDNDDQRYIDDQKAQQDLANPRGREYFGPSRQVTKHITSVSDARFKVRVNFSQSRIQKHRSGALVISLSVDGNHLKSCTWENKKHGDSLTFKDKAVATPAGLVRKPFLFSEIVIRNDHSDKADTTRQNLDGMGTILVKIFRVRMTGRPIRIPAARYEGQVFEGLQVVSDMSEHKLKGRSLTHSVNLGPGKPFKPERKKYRRQTHYIDGQIPIFTFEFKYCSRKALKDMLIIPRTPSPPPLSTPAARIPSPVGPKPLHERPLDELSREELLELARAQKEQLSTKREANTPIIKNEVRMVKTERQEFKSEPKTGIKRERDDGDADEDDFQITMSRSVRFKPAASKIETINLESDTEDEWRLSIKSTKLKHQIEHS